MQTKTCDKCGKEIPEDSKFCPICGESVPDAKTENTLNNTGYSSGYRNKKNKTPKWVIAIIVFVVIVAIIGIAGNSDDAETSDTSAEIERSEGDSFSGNHESDTKKETDKKGKNNSKTKEPKPTKKPKTKKEIKGDYIKSCKEYSYKKVLRNPDKYIGKKIKVKVKISSVHEKGLLTPTKYYFANSKGDYGWYGDQYGIFDKRNAEKPKLLEDDIIEVYGEIAEPEETSSLIVNSQELFCIDMKYVKIISE